MSDQPDLFDIQVARAARDEGVHRVASNNAEFLKVARKIARRIAGARGTVTSDDVRRECLIDPIHPNAWGGVFRTGDFEWTGEYFQSSIVTRHAGMQRVWRLKGKAPFSGMTYGDHRG